MSAGRGTGGGDQGLELQVNGERRTSPADPSTPLLFVLRNDLGLTAAKLGCGLEQCGACAVLVGGVSTLSCVAPAASFAGREIWTLEGLAQTPLLARLRDAFVAEGAAQCGYCTPGIVVAALALLRSSPAPTPARIREALEPHLCRCGTHAAVLRAVASVSTPGAR